MLFIFAENEKKAEAYMKKKSLKKEDAKYIETGKTIRDAGEEPEYVCVGDYKSNRYASDILNALETCKAVEKK